MICIKLLINAFDDDTNLLYTDSDPLNLQRTLDKELKELVEWLRANRLSLNVDKTEFIIVRPSRKVLNNRITLNNCITLNLEHKNIF